MDFPGQSPTPLFVSTWSRWTAAWDANTANTGITPAAGTWPTANTAYYIPVALPWAYPVKRVFWVNGSSVTSTNMNFGIYTFDGTLIYQVGSTVATPINVPQYTTQDILLSASRYYFAMVCSSTTAGRGGFSTVALTANVLRMGGVLQEASAMTLPATMTPVAISSAFYPLCGVTRTTTGF